MTKLPPRWMSRQLLTTIHSCRNKPAREKKNELRGKAIWVGQDRGGGRKESERDELISAAAEFEHRTLNSKAYRCSEPGKNSLFISNRKRKRPWRAKRYDRLKDKEGNGKRTPTTKIVGKQGGRGEIRLLVSTRNVFTSETKR